MTNENIEYLYRLKGVHLDAYNAVVQPTSVFAVQTYTIRRWAPILGATAFWLLIALQQESYRNPKGDNWCVVSRPRLARAAGMSEATVHRCLHGKQYTQSLLCHWVRVPDAEAVRHRPRRRATHDGRLVQPPNRYTVVMDAPLAPVDQRGLAQFLRERGARVGAPAEVVIPALRDLSAWSLNDLLDLCDELSERFTPPEGWEETAFYPTVAEVVRALGVEPPKEEKGRTEFLSLCSDVQNAFIRQRYLGTQYFLQQWLPVLGPKLALVVIYLRSMCFHNEETRRDVVASLTFSQLAQAVGCSARWLKSIDETRPEVSLFFRIERAGRGYAPAFRVNLLDPIAPEDRERYEQLLRSEPVNCWSGEKGTGELLIAEVDAGGGARKDETATTNVANEGMGNEGGGTPATKSNKIAAPEDDVEKPEEPSREKGTGELLIAEKGTGELLRSEPVNCWSGEKGTGELLRSELVNSLKGTGEQHISTISTYISTSGKKALKQQHARAPAAAALLADFGVGPPASDRILAQRIPPDRIRAWMLYALTQPGLADPRTAAGYVVNRLLSGQPPPDRFVHWAQLTRTDWRDLWRAARYGAVYQAALSPRLKRAFESWRDDFAGVFPDGPFGDEAVDAPLIRTVVAELRGDPAALDVRVPQGRGVIIIEPVTDAAQEWLRGAGESLRTTLRQRGIYHRLQLAVDAGSTANSAPDSELAALWDAALEDLSARLARSTFDNLFLGSQLIELDESSCVVGLRDEHARAWAQARLKRRVEDVLAAVLGRRVEVTFETLAPARPGLG